MSKIWPGGKVVIDRSWTMLPRDVIKKILLDEYGLTLEEWQKKSLPFPEDKKEEYFKSQERFGEGDKK